MTVDPADVRHLIRSATQRTGSPVFDEDLAQEALVRAIDAFRRAGHVAHPRAFLKKVVLDTVRDHWRRRRPGEQIESVDERLLCFHPQFEDDLDRGRQKAVLRLALGRLDASKRELIRMFYEEGLTLREIAGKENISVPALKMKLMRTRRELARFVDVAAKKKSR